MLARLLVPAVFVVLTACAKEPLLDPKLPAPDAGREAEKPAVAEEEAVPKGALSRPSLDRMLHEGPGYVLEKVPVDEVVVGGKFVGWRVRELPAEWSGGDLRPGDVVTRLNGLPIETPNDFWSAWTTLGVASEVKLDYRRGEEARVLTIPIVGKPTAVAGAKPTDKPADGRPARDKRFETVTIEGDPTSSSPPVDWTTGN